MVPTITKPWPGTLAAGLKRGLSAGFLARASLWRCAKRAASARRSVSVGGGEVVFIRAAQALRVLKTLRSRLGLRLFKIAHFPSRPIWRMRVHVAERHRRARLPLHHSPLGSHSITLSEFGQLAPPNPLRLAEQIMAQQVIKATPPGLIRVAANINALDELRLSRARIFHVDVDIED